MKITFNLQKFTRSEINKLSLVKNGDCGLYGYIYRLNEEECLKYYKVKIDDFQFYKLNDFTKYSFEAAVFPKRLVLVNNKFRGYIMDYVDGCRLDECTNMDFSLLVRLYKEYIDRILDEVSEERIEMLDVHSGNIMYDSKKEMFRSIDCEDWTIENLPVYQIRESNFRKLNLAFRSAITGDDFHFMKKITMDTDFVDYYESYREKIEIKSKKKILKVQDFINYYWR